jgi:hypothetical protein
MKRSFQVLGCVLLITLGAGLFSFIYHNHVIKLSIGHESVQSFIGIILIAIGAFVLNETLYSQKNGHHRYNL